VHAAQRDAAAQLCRRRESSSRSRARPCVAPRAQQRSPRARCAGTQLCDAIEDIATSPALARDLSGSIDYGVMAYPLNGMGVGCGAFLLSFLCDMYVAELERRLPTSRHKMARATADALLAPLGAEAQQEADATLAKPGKRALGRRGSVAERLAPRVALGTSVAIVLQLALTFVGILIPFFHRWIHGTLLELIGAPPDSTTLLPSTRCPLAFSVLSSRHRFPFAPLLQTFWARAISSRATTTSWRSSPPP